MPSNTPTNIVAPVVAADAVEVLPDVILDALAELYWDERINHPAIAALRA